MSHNALADTIAAAVLDGMTVTFAPDPADAAATRIRIGVRHGHRGRVYENSCDIRLGDVTRSDTADTMLAKAVADTCRPGA